VTVLGYFALGNRHILLEKPCKDHESRSFPRFRGCGKNFLYVPFPYHLSEIVMFQACQEDMSYHLTPPARGGHECKFVGFEVIRIRIRQCPELIRIRRECEYIRNIFQGAR
jgi:hypothetical protein